VGANPACESSPRRGATPHKKVKETRDRGLERREEKKKGKGGLGVGRDYSLLLLHVLDVLRSNHFL
jgi:hypothetical protein